VRLTCLDDDDQGRALDVLWELELGARVLAPEASGLGDVDRLDEPSRFGAYLHALRWNSVTATDPHLFQSPFRAGIQIIDHQLIPLKKALELPRANLFIADDVGLGKTIEAGLVLQELVLRQRVDFVLIVCPSVDLPPVARRDGQALRPAVRDLQPRARRSPPARARLRGEPVGDPQPLHRLPLADPPPRVPRPAPPGAASRAWANARARAC
jgi:hypothetical protein